MNSTNEKIAPSQLMFLMTGFVLGSVLLLSFMDNLAKQDSWIAIITAFTACIPFVLSIALLAKKFPGKTFSDILCIIYGKVVGTVIFVLYIGIFFILLSFNMRDLADFYIGFIMPEMPMPVLLIIIVLVCGYAVYKGILSISKVGLISLAYSIFTIITTFMLLIKDMDFKNFLPVFEVPLGTFVQSTHVLTALPFCEVFVFLMVMPSLNSYKKIGKYALGGVGFAALAFLVITVRNTAVLGPSSVLYAGNSYQAARMINIGEFLTRVELLTAVGITVSLFTKLSVLFYASVKSVSQLFHMQSASPLILPLGGLAIILALIAFDSTIVHSYVGMRYHAFFTLLFAFVFPPLSLLVCAVRGLPKKEEGGGQ